MSEDWSSDDLWIAIDFETATSDRFSACALGVAVIQNGAIAGTSEWLIQPPGNVYDWRNIGVHGITPEMTEYAPTYHELYERIEPFLTGRNLVAHSASFDVSVIRAVHGHYGLPMPEAAYVCSCQMARRAFPALGNHRLPTVCDHCGIALDHHDAGSDALACARVAMSCRDAAGAVTIGDALELLGMRTKPLAGA